MQKRVLRHLPLAEDEEAFMGAAPLLFGDTFKRRQTFQRRQNLPLAGRIRMKDHLESPKCPRCSMAPKSGTDQLFEGAAPSTSQLQKKRRGTTPISKEAGKILPEEDPIPARNNDKRICNCKCVHIPTTCSSIA